MSPAERPLVTVVCPVFNEEAAIPVFHQRITRALQASEDRVRVELLFVNNRSTDRTLEVLRELKRSDPRVRYLTMSRNYGYQASITAGMRHARGDAVANIDVDCEDPPELIPRFIDRWLSGVDVVYGIREQRSELYLMHLARKLFYRVTRVVADHEIVLDMAEFFLVDRRVRDHVLATRSTFPFVRGQLGYVGFRREGIPYKRERRAAGRTHYNLLGAIRFGVAGILSSSTLPLRALAYVGAFAFVLDVALAALALATGGSLGLDPFQRWVIALVALHLGWIPLALGSLGIYLARAYKDGLALPLYIVDERESDLESLAGPRASDMSGPA
ncbi:MAG TPA: glycosyltransferase family 2 protein [Myxococcales bacterium]|nr:glycosyltransferase family 2 protein [Myxococcales bacterium]